MQVENLKPRPRFHRKRAFQSVLVIKIVITNKVNAPNTYVKNVCTDTSTFCEKEQI